MLLLARRALSTTIVQCRRRISIDAKNSKKNFGRFKPKKTLEERQVEALEKTARSMEYLKVPAVFSTLLMAFYFPMVACK